MLVLPTFLERTSGAATGSGLFSGSGRGSAWRYFAERIAERPWTGFGPGSGPWLAEQSTNKTVREYFISPHNEYLRFSADIGIPLAVVFFVSLVILVFMTARAASREMRVLVIAVSASMLAYGIFDNLLNAPQSAVGFALLLACFWAGTANKHATDGEHDSPRRSYRQSLYSQ